MLTGILRSGCGSRSPRRWRAQHPEDEVAGLAEDGVLAVDEPECLKQGLVACSSEATRDHLAPSPVPGRLPLPRTKLVNHAIEATTPSVARLIPSDSDQPFTGSSGAVRDPLPFTSIIFLFYT